jgi:hypothetical protein
MGAYLEREKARVTYFNSRSVLRQEELVAKEAAAEAKERQDAALQAVREAEIQAATAALSEGEVLDLAKLDREKARRKKDKDETDFLAMERAIMGDIGLNADTFVVPTAAKDVFEEEAAAEEEIKKTAASSKRGSAPRLSEVNVDSIDLELKA